MRKFHVGVAHRRLRNVQKSVMQVRSSCFVYINLLFFCFFCRTRCHRRRRCLSSLLSFTGDPEILLPWLRNVTLLLSSGLNLSSIKVQ